MGTLKTNITEIATDLGTLPGLTLETALVRPPDVVCNVTDDHWRRLRDAYFDRRFPREFKLAHRNGRAFLMSDAGLRHRSPVRVEWKGEHRPPGYDLLPADAAQARHCISGTRQADHTHSRAIDFQGTLTHWIREHDLKARCSLRSICATSTRPERPPEPLSAAVVVMWSGCIWRLECCS